MADLSNTPLFHIAIDAPAGVNYPSFASSDLGDLSKVTLAMIRNQCRISPKLFFTADGKNPIADSTQLLYYMSLTPEGAKILGHGSTEIEAVDPAAKAPADPKEDTTKVVAVMSTFSIKVSDSKTAAATLRDLPAANAALEKLLGEASAGKIERGQLPVFADRALRSLSAEYATQASSYDYKAASDLTEQDWDKIFLDNRAFHGYSCDARRGVIMKAKKKAFKLRGAAPVGVAPDQGTRAQGQLEIPPMPPFFIEDRASVSVHEIRDQFQERLAKDGFNSTGVSASLGAGQIPVSVSASYESEHGKANQELRATDVTSLITVYNFPRAVIELDPESLELTAQCKRDVLNITNNADKERFFRDYGNVFVTRFTLGGFLHSTQHISSEERSNLDQVKDKSRASAGISIQTPKVSGGVNVANVSSSSQDVGTGALFQETRLTWDANGGDTLLCSNPPAWAGTVRNPRLWRLMDQQRVVSLEWLIKDIDTVAFGQLETPTTVTRVEGDLLRDGARQDQARATLLNVLRGDRERNATFLRMKSYYQGNNMNTAAGIEPYNKLVNLYFADEPDLVIDKGTLFGGLNQDQLLGLGLFLGSKDIISL